MAWLGTWSYRKKIKLSGAYMPSTLLEVPIPINLSTSSGRLEKDLTAIFTELGAESKKIALTLSDGVTQLPVEVSLWDNSNNRAQLFTKLDTLADNDIYLYLYYDSSQADNAMIGDPQSAIALTVWHSDFARVFNFNIDWDDLIVNGDFSDGETGWSYLAGITHSISGGDQYINRNGQGYAPHAYQSFSTEIGKTYAFAFFIGTISHVLNVRLYDGTDEIGLADGITTSTDNNWFTGTFVATGTTSTIRFYLSSSTSAYAYYDNVSVKIAEPNSVNAAQFLLHKTVSYTEEDALGGKGIVLSDDEFFMPEWTSGNDFTVAWVGKKGNIDYSSEHVLTSDLPATSSGDGRIWVSANHVLFQTYATDIKQILHNINDTNYHFFSVVIEDDLYTLYVDSKPMGTAALDAAGTIDFYNIAGKDFTSSVEYLSSFGGL